MKKIVFTLVVLLFAAPTWATVVVDITVAQVGDTNEVIISWATSGLDPNLVRAFGLNIQLNNDANILEVTGLSADYSIYPGTIQIDAFGEVTNEGTIAAEYADLPSDTLAGPPDGTGVTLECASLYAPVGPGSPNAPVLSGDLCSIKVSKSTCLTITANVSRAGTTGVVMENPDDVATVNYPVELCIEVGPPPCFSGEHIDHDEWVDVGSPDSWCYKYQCYGDADGKRNGSPFTGYSRVRVEDLNVLISGWEVPGYVDPVTHPWIAADFDRKLNGSPFTGYSRIRVEDLNILVTNWETDAGIPMESPNCGGEVDLSPP